MKEKLKVSRHNMIPQNVMHYEYVYILSALKIKYCYNPFHISLHLCSIRIDSLQR